MKNNERLPAVFVTHGGGPCFFMDWNPPGTWTKMGNWLQSLAGTFKVRPEAIVIISGHWEEEEFTVHTGEKAPLLYDYYGFPEHTYQLRYDAPGAPELAGQVKSLLAENGMNVRSESERGWDHGVFVPLKMIFPEAEIPVLQLSLKNNLDPAAHLRLGRALRPLREQGVLILGSGSSYHNLRAWGPAGREVSKAFDDWLTETVETEDRELREKRLEEWDKTPAGRTAHPREEHLVPLMVTAGAAYDGEKGRKIFSDVVNGVTLSAFQFGDYS